jgi:hypothetical protein
MVISRERSESRNLLQRFDDDVRRATRNPTQPAKKIPNTAFHRAHKGKLSFQPSNARGGIRWYAGPPTMAPPT